MFTSIPAKDDPGSQPIGLDLYNNAKQDIGTIKGIAFSQNGVKAYIVGVGGFLGMGDHYVAVRPSAVTLSYDATEKKWHVRDGHQCRSTPGGSGIQASQKVLTARSRTMP